MTTILPKDADNNAIQALRLRPNGAHTIAATTTSARNVTAFATTTKIVSLYATGPVFVRFGNSTVTATNTDHFYPDGFYYDFAIGGGDKGYQFTHVAVIAAGSNCTLYVSEKE